MIDFILKIRTNINDITVNALCINRPDTDIVFQAKLMEDAEEIVREYVCSESFDMMGFKEAFLNLSYI